MRERLEVIFLRARGMESEYTMALCVQVPTHIGPEETKVISGYSEERPGQDVAQRTCYGIRD